MSLCKHDMEEDWCADCNGTVEQQQVEEKNRRQVLGSLGYFPAQYPGWCTGCGSHFGKAVMIIHDGDDGYVAECCYDG